MGRALALFVLALGVLGFGAAGLCGAVFTAVSVPEVFKGGHENYAGAALIFSVPSLLIGSGLCWLCVRLLKRLRAQPTPTSTEDPAP